MASLTRWTWDWVNSRSWWWTGRPGMLRFMGSQRVRQDLETELNWTISSNVSFLLVSIFFFIFLKSDVLINLKEKGYHWPSKTAIWDVKVIVRNFFPLSPLSLLPLRLQTFLHAMPQCNEKAEALLKYFLIAFNLHPSLFPFARSANHPHLDKMVRKPTCLVSFPWLSETISNEVLKSHHYVSSKPS